MGFRDTEIGECRFLKSWNNSFTGQDGPGNSGISNNLGVIQGTSSKAIGCSEIKYAGWDSGVRVIKKVGGFTGFRDCCRFVTGWGLLSSDSWNDRLLEL